MNIDDFRLFTPRLELRVHRPDDADFMIDLNSDPEVTRYVPDGPIELPQAQKLIASIRNQFVERRMGRFLVSEKQTGKRLGWCGLKWIEDLGAIDLGYRFLKSSWGKGYAFEAAQACLEYAFKGLKLERIIATIAPENSASLNLAKKLRMKEVSRIIEDGQEFLVFEIHSADWILELRS